ncbi:shikimate kinase [Bacillus sp. OAE603]|uniref:shikimate kinase n=1 Tax=Gottfriedia sp. OAE603 TaxID=2663872 RepID=UPI00178937CB
MKSIYLVGFMGCGKTSVGKIIAKALNCHFIDLDEEIVSHTGKSIPTIFEEKGENGFRIIESEVLKKVSSDSSIISTGGGIVTCPENIVFMKQNGIIFYLESTIETLYKRIHQDSNRPNAVNRSLVELKNLFISRKSFYEKADFTISVTEKSPKDVSVEIINCLNSLR